MNMVEALGRDVEARVTAWLAAVARVPPDGFTPVERMEDIADQARADSWFWCDSIFREEANPHGASVSARHAYHLATSDTPDLLRHEYTAVGRKLVVTEGRNFILVEVDRSSLDLLSLCGEDRAAAVREIAGSLFNLGSEVAAMGPAGGSACAPLEVPENLDEGVMFSSNPAADPELLSCWRDRTECGVRGGSLYFLCYKKASQCVGYANPQQWFDDTFRARFA